MLTNDLTWVVTGLLEVSQAAVHVAFIQTASPPPNGGEGRRRGRKGIILSDVEVPRVVLGGEPMHLAGNPI